MAIDRNGLARLYRVARVARLRPRPSTSSVSGRRASAEQSLRDYAPGDDYRAVDWHLCARHDELRVAVLPRRPIQPVGFLIDASASMTVGSRPKARIAEQTVALLGALALAAPTDAPGPETSRLLGATYSDRVLRQSPPLDDLGRWAAWLAANEDAASPERSDFDRVARQFLRSRPLPGDVWVVTDAFEFAGLVAGLARLATHGCRPHLLHVVDPADGAPDVAGDVELVDVETGRRWATTVTRRDLALFRREYDAWLGDIRTACRRMGIDVRTVPVAADFGALVRIAQRSGIV